jgi:hypothetical protein
MGVPEGEQMERDKESIFNEIIAEKFQVLGEI